MYNKYKILLIFFLILFATNHADTLTDTEIEALIDRMSVEEKVGQLLIFGVGGRDVGPVAKAHITKRFVGGVVLYARNIKDPTQVAALTVCLQHVAQETPNTIPLFIAIDQEGVIVTR
ncbi:MAG: hypothetical protein OXU23_01625, partial [Candidatus Poribacteria bacterium]|nr:hypothetical protein [Candidatus Poribacteria bacterium]